MVQTQFRFRMRLRSNKLLVPTPGTMRYSFHQSGRRGTANRYALYKSLPLLVSAMLSLGCAEHDGQSGSARISVSGFGADLVLPTDCEIGPLSETHGEKLVLINCDVYDPRGVVSIYLNRKPCEINEAESFEVTVTDEASQSNVHFRAMRSQFKPGVKVSEKMREPIYIRQTWTDLFCMEALSMHPEHLETLFRPIWP
jgi:hypothetical protein